MERYEPGPGFSRLLLLLLVPNFEDELAKPVKCGRTRAEAPRNSLPCAWLYEQHTNTHIRQNAILREAFQRTGAVKV